jgi:hypothetical protein
MFPEEPKVHATRDGALHQIKYRVCILVQRRCKYYNLKHFRNTFQKEIQTRPFADKDTMHCPVNLNRHLPHVTNTHTYREREREIQTHMS